MKLISRVLFIILLFIIDGICGQQVIIYNEKGLTENWVYREQISPKPSTSYKTSFTFAKPWLKQSYSECLSKIGVKDACLEDRAGTIFIDEMKNGGIELSAWNDWDIEGDFYDQYKLMGMKYPCLYNKHNDAGQHLIGDTKLPNYGFYIIIDRSNKIGVRIDAVIKHTSVTPHTFDELEQKLFQHIRELSFGYGDKTVISSTNASSSIKQEPVIEDDNELLTIAIGILGAILAGGMVVRIRNKSKASKSTAKKKIKKSLKKDSPNNDKQMTMKEAIENVSAPSVIPQVIDLEELVKNSAEIVIEVDDVTQTLKNILVNPEDGGIISNNASKNVDRLKGVKAVLEDGSQLILDKLTKTQIDLHDIHSLKKIFDKNGKVIINNMDDVKKYADLLKKNDKRIKNLKISKKAGKVFKAVGIGFEIYDAVDRIGKVSKQRGYTKEDGKYAVVSELAHKFVLLAITENPVVGAIDCVVSIILPDCNVENIMRTGEDAWHEKTKEYFKNIFDNSDELATQQLKEFNRFKKKIMSKNISEEEKLKRIKKIYKIVVG